jgi:hypothetical protein
MLEGGPNRHPDDGKKNNKISRVNAIILFHKRDLPAAMPDHCSRSFRRELGHNT